MARPRKKTELKARPAASVPPQLAAHAFKPGQSGNPSGKPKRKPFSDVLLALIEKPAPQEFFINGLEALKPQAKTMTLSDLILARLLYSAATGIENKGLKSAIEVINRTEGKVPLPVVSREIDRDQFVGITEQELDEKLGALVQQVKLLTAGEPIQ